MMFGDERAGPSERCWVGKKSHPNFFPLAHSPKMNTYAMPVEQVPMGQQPVVVEAAITCLSCGKAFPFSQTVEGRCMRDHMLHTDRENLKQQVARSNAGGGNITITGPTVTGPTISQTTSQQATQQATQAVVRPQPTRYYGMTLFSWIAGGICYCIFLGVVIPIIVTSSAKSSYSSYTPSPTPYY